MPNVSSASATSSSTSAQTVAGVRRRKRRDDGESDDGGGGSEGGGLNKSGVLDQHQPQQQQFKWNMSSLKSLFQSILPPQRRKKRTSSKRTNRWSIINRREDTSQAVRLPPSVVESTRPPLLVLTLFESPSHITTDPSTTATLSPPPQQSFTISTESIPTSTTTLTDSITKLSDIATSSSSIEINHPINCQSITPNFVLSKEPFQPFITSSHTTTTHPQDEQLITPPSSPQMNISPPPLLLSPPSPPPPSLPLLIITPSSPALSHSLLPQLLTQPIQPPLPSPSEKDTIPFCDSSSIPAPTPLAKLDPLTADSHRTSRTSHTTNHINNNELSYIPPDNEPFREASIDSLCDTLSPDSPSSDETLELGSAETLSPLSSSPTLIPSPIVVETKLLLWKAESRGTENELDSAQSSPTLPSTSPDLELATSDINLKSPPASPASPPPSTACLSKVSSPILKTSGTVSTLTSSDSQKKLNKRLSFGAMNVMVCHYEPTAFPIDIASTETYFAVDPASARKSADHAPPNFLNLLPPRQWHVVTSTAPGLHGPVLHPGQVVALESARIISASDTFDGAGGEGYCCEDDDVDARVVTESEAFYDDYNDDEDEDYGEVYDSTVTLLLTVLVRNLAFEKKISVVSTSDQWRSLSWTDPSADTQFLHCASSSGGGVTGVDRFHVRVNVAVPPRLIPGFTALDAVSANNNNNTAGSYIHHGSRRAAVRVEFAVKCEMAGAEHWDSRNGTNHVVDLLEEETILDHLPAGGGGGGCSMMGGGLLGGSGRQKVELQIGTDTQVFAALQAASQRSAEKALLNGSLAAAEAASIAREYDDTQKDVRAYYARMKRLEMMTSSSTTLDGGSCTSLLLDDTGGSLNNNGSKDSCFTETQSVMVTMANGFKEIYI